MMTSIKAACVIALLGMSTTGRAQNQKSRSMLGREWASETLQAALKDHSLHNVVSKTSLLIPDSATAVQVAEPILFSIYSKESILNQRPYATYLIDHYWLIKGTLPQGRLGGTFLIILDARDSRVVRLTHGK